MLPQLLLLLSCLHASPAAALALHARLPSGSDASFDVDKRTRDQWKELVEICPMRNYTSCDGMERSTWTDVSKVRPHAAMLHVAEHAACS